MPPEGANGYLLYDCDADPSLRGARSKKKKENKRKKGTKRNRQCVFLTSWTLIVINHALLLPLPPPPNQLVMDRGRADTDGAGPR